MPGRYRVNLETLQGQPMRSLDPIEVVVPDGGGEAWVTVHPSFLLRVRDNREAEYGRFVEDLHRIGERAKAIA